MNAKYYKYNNFSWLVNVNGIDCFIEGNNKYGYKVKIEYTILYSDMDFNNCLKWCENNLCLEYCKNL